MWKCRASLSQWKTTILVDFLKIKMILLEGMQCLLCKGCIFINQGYKPKQTLLKLTKMLTVDVNYYFSLVKKI